MRSCMAPLAAPRLHSREAHAGQQAQGGAQPPHLCHIECSAQCRRSIGHTHVVRRRQLCDYKAGRCAPCKQLLGDGAAAQLHGSEE